MQICQQRAHQPAEQRRARGCSERPRLRCETLLIPHTKAAGPATAPGQLQEQGRGFASSTLPFP